MRREQSLVDDARTSLSRLDELRTMLEAEQAGEAEAKAEAEAHLQNAAAVSEAGEAFVAERCEAQSFSDWKTFASRPENSPEAMSDITGVPADVLRGAARLYAKGGNAAIYYGLGVTEHAQGSTMVMGIANLAMATGNIGREGVGVNPLRGQNNVQDS